MHEPGKANKEACVTTQAAHYAIKLKLVTAEEADNIDGERRFRRSKLRQ